jgi:glycosyltransferase involved in cell wall biosynthesis
MSGGRPGILIISTSPVTARMTGVGIRAYELAKVLASVGDVVIAAPESGSEFGGVPIIAYDHRRPHALKEPIRRADVVVAQPQWPAVARWLGKSSARVAFDLYDPEIFENLEFFSASGQRLPGLWTALTLDRLAMALHRGDFFMCATDSQRDLWLGTMVAERIVTPSLYAGDPTMRSVISTVPFGLPDEPCERVEGGGIRDHVPGLPGDAEIVLWNGGLWGWLDARTVIRAVARVHESRPSVRLVFMGASDHPAAATAACEAEDLASELGLLDEVVFFNRSWVPYDERANWLLDAACAVSAHLDHLETRFAFRTRVLDCFWSGLPIVCSRGDALSDLIERRDLGAVADPGDVDGFADGIEEVLGRGRGAYADALAEAARAHSWPVVARPLREFVESGTRPHRGRLGGVSGVVRARSVAYRSASAALTTVQRLRSRGARDA